MTPGAESRTSACLRYGVVLAGFFLCIAYAFPQAPPQQKTFDTPEQAAEALILAAEQYNVEALKEILGPDGVDLVVTEDEVQSQNQSTAFAAEARTAMRVVRDAKNPKVAFLNVGKDEWPLPIPMVEKRGKWRFDSKAGRQEILLRRIGRNELDAIEICRGYVEAQHEYASEKRDGSSVNQYAQKIVSNSKRLAAEVNARGIPVVAPDAGFTRSHTVILRVAAFGSREEAGRRLERAGIIASSARLPESLGGQAIRLGLQEVTRMGARENDIQRSQS